MASNAIEVYRDVVIELDSPGSLQGLVDQLVALVARPAIGPDAVVKNISGSVTRFRMTLTKPEP